MNCIWRVEVDGDWTDYADCYFSVIASTRKEAWKKAKAIENRKIKRIFLVRQL